LTHDGGHFSQLTSRFLADYGFSIGISDVQPTARLTTEKASLLARGYAQCSEVIAQFEEGKLPPSPGCTPEQTLESEINGTPYGHLAEILSKRPSRRSSRRSTVRRGVAVRTASRRGWLM
jgi:hypothetical protein